VDIGKNLNKPQVPKLQVDAVITAEVLDALDNDLVSKVPQLGLQFQVNQVGKENQELRQSF
jgi:hypothetical protein